jgi:hypothetical protein
MDEKPIGFIDLQICTNPLNNVNYLFRLMQDILRTQFSIHRALKVCAELSGTDTFEVMREVNRLLEK